jgi:hypothetical protein
MTEMPLIRTSELVDIAALWTDRCGRYVLIHTRGSPQDALMPYDKVERRLVLIDGPGLHAPVTKNMLDAGVPVEEVDVTMDRW